MFVIGYGINMDVEDLTFAVLDRDDTRQPRLYLRSPARATSSSGADHRPCRLDRRMRSGEISSGDRDSAGFRCATCARPPASRSAPGSTAPCRQRAETVQGYVQGMHLRGWPRRRRAVLGQRGHRDFQLELRFRYNPDVKSLVAMVPAVIPLLLMMIPAMLAALSVVREKELGSIINLYVTPGDPAGVPARQAAPLRRARLLNFLMLTASPSSLRGAADRQLSGAVRRALLYVIATTGWACHLDASCAARSPRSSAQRSHLIPAVQFSGMIDPVSSLRGRGCLIGRSIRRPIS
jgi:ribosome-dependent ATPase